MFLLLSTLSLAVAINVEFNTQALISQAPALTMAATSEKHLRATTTYYLNENIYGDSNCADYAFSQYLVVPTPSQNVPCTNSNGVFFNAQFSESTPAKLSGGVLMNVFPDSVTGCTGTPQVTAFFPSTNCIPPSTGIAAPGYDALAFYCTGGNAYLQFYDDGACSTTSVGPVLIEGCSSQWFAQCV
jgi:hypothetical protein